MGYRSAAWSPTYGSNEFLAGNIPELDYQWFNTAQTLTSQALADSFFAGSAGYVDEFDLLAMTQVRLTCRVTTDSASASAPIIEARFATAFSGTNTNYAQFGSTAKVASSLFTGASTLGIADSGWLEIAPAARINNCFVGLFMSGGNASASPVIQRCSMAFR